MMQKYLVIASVLVMLCNISSHVFAGPSYSVECEDISRGTRLHLFDANPRIGFMAARGMHNQLPEGMESFAASSNGPIPLNVVSYKSYEVELKLAAKPGTAPPYIISGNEAKTNIGTLEKIVLENHSATEIADPPRLGAATLVLSSGLQLRFNNCKIKGDISVHKWEDTFKSTSSN